MTERTKIFLCILTVLVIGFFLACVISANAQDRHGWHGGGGGGWHGGGQEWHHGGWGGGPRYGDFGSAIVGSAIGGWLWHQFNPPSQVIVEQPMQQGPTVEWCMQRYRSYNPQTHTYLGYDGQFHGCP